MFENDPNRPAAEFEQLDHISSAIFVLEVDKKGMPRYVAFNAFALALFGKPLSHFLGRPATKVFPQAFGRSAQARHCEVAHNGKPITYDLDLPLAIGTRSMRTTLMPHRDDKTGRYLLYGCSFDISVEQAVREKQVSFDTLSKEMEQFVALAAHDLRAPMRNMAILAEMLKENFIDHGDGKLELLDMMEDVANKSMVLISDVLDHARTAHVSNSRTSFNLSALCQDICDVLDPHGKHRFTCTAAQISTDRTAMQIALRNIIDNAMKFGGKDSLHIDIKVLRGAKGMLNVVMSDDGQGFSEPAIEFLNGGAFKVDSGYGLLGVRRMVEARGGTVTASNGTASNGTDGMGAIIRFCLPGKWLGATNTRGDMIEQWKQDAKADRKRPPRRRA